LQAGDSTCTGRSCISDEVLRWPARFRAAHDVACHARPNSPSTFQTVSDCPEVLPMLHVRLNGCAALRAAPAVHATRGREQTGARPPGR